MSANANLYAAFEQRFAEAGERAAFILADGTTITYAAFADSVARMANALSALGVEPATASWSRSRSRSPTSRFIWRRSSAAPSTIR